MVISILCTVLVMLRGMGIEDPGQIPELNRLKTASGKIQMTLLFPLLGGTYGYLSSRGQFCMNSGFSNVSRYKDTTKLKAYILAILVQAVSLPILFLFREQLGLALDS